MTRCWTSLFFIVGVFGAEPVDLIVSGRQVVTMDGAGRIIENGAVAVRGERIVAVINGIAEQTNLRMISNLIDCDPTTITFGAPVILAFTQHPNGQQLPVFRLI